MPEVLELLRSAKQALARGDHERALPLLRLAVELAPEAFGPQMLLGVCLSTAGQHNQAVSELERAVQLNPDSAQGYYNLGAAFRSAGKLRDAERNFRLALRLNPDYPAAAASLVAVHSALAKNEKKPRSASADPKVPDTYSTDRTSPQKPMQNCVASLDQPSVPQRKRGRSSLAKPLTKWALFCMLGAFIATTAAGWPTNPHLGNWLLWRQTGAFTDLDISPDGTLLAAAGPGLSLWRTSSGRRVGTLLPEHEQTAEVAFSPTGEFIASVTRDIDTGTAIKLWRTSDGSLVKAFPSQAGDRALAFSPDGSLLAVGTDYMSTAEPLGVQLWRIPDLQLVRSLGTPPSGYEIGYVCDIAFSPDGKLLASTDDAGTLRIFTVCNGDRIKTIETGNLVLTSVAFTSDGNLAYGGMSHPGVNLRSVPDGRELALLIAEDHLRLDSTSSSAVNSLHCASEANLIVSSEIENGRPLVRVFDTAQRRLRHTIDVGAQARWCPLRWHEHNIRRVCIYPDGSHVAWCGSSGIAVAEIPPSLPP